MRNNVFLGTVANVYNARLDSDYSVVLNPAICRYFRRNIMSLAEELLGIKTENKNLDYKESLNWDTSPKDEKIGIIKDILAMANTQDGGKIFFGVRDSDLSLVGLSQEDFSSFDQTKVNDLLHVYTDPKFSCNVYKEKVKEKFVVIIDVPEFQEIPIICKKDCHTSEQKNKQILRKGQIYIRTEKGTSEIITSSEEMREFLGRAISKKGDELLRNIELLIKGKPVKSATEDREKYETELTVANDFFTRKLTDLSKFGHWQICAYPVNYSERRVKDPIAIKLLLDKSIVSLRGWSFPHAQNNSDHGGKSNFSNGVQSFTDWEGYLEGFRVYLSGLFVWKGKFLEETDRYKKRTGKILLEFVHCIWSVTEFFLFLKRFYEQVESADDLYISISLYGCNNRKLTSTDFGVPLWDNYTCMQEEPIVVEQNIKLVELKASYKEIAARVIKQIFLIFNWYSVSDAIIEEWQTKLIERKF